MLELWKLWGGNIAFLVYTNTCNLLVELLTYHGVLKEIEFEGIYLSVKLAERVTSGLKLWSIRLIHAQPMALRKHIF